MQSVEFKTTVKNGVIPIPRQYKNNVTDKVHVIVFSENIIEKPKKKKFTHWK